VAIEFSAHISWLFVEHPYLERVSRARAAGFGCIETGWPQDTDLGELARQIERNRMCVALVNADGGDLAAGERGFLNDPARLADAERAFLKAAELALRIGSPCVHVMLGRALPAIPEYDQRAAVIAGLRSCARLADERGLTVLVEPMNELDVPGYFAPSPEAVAALIAQVGSPQVRMLFDAYHVARAGRDPLTALDAAAPLIGHVQFADCPGRGPPGTGALDLWGLLERLEILGYGGAIGFEYRPDGPTEQTLGFLRGRPAARHD
jgi:hydroxypyruvate isomerase